MYEQFYNLAEKPFTLLPDPGFLYMSDKHRMAATLLEYGLRDHAGFTVISGEIGAGKTTLIRNLLNNMEQEYTVGLITNTHRSFGELMHWILLAFNIEHRDLDKVGMYQRFVDFVIGEYAQNRRTVLIIDEAQNMDADTLEELRMLSNINADKDIALQVILSGQRELRDTLRKPELVQFAQRITVDYHLEPLSAIETAGYIRHRLQVAAGDPNIFTPEACEAVYRFSSGVPRLINLLCDTALVYGFAEQVHHIDDRLVTEVAHEKQRGGIFPVHDAEPEARVMPAEPAQPQPGTAAPAADAGTAPPPEPAASVDTDSGAGQAVGPAVATGSATPEPEPQPAPSARAVDQSHEDRRPPGPVKKKLRLAVCSEQDGFRRYLERLLESYGFDVVVAVPPEAGPLQALDPSGIDVLLVDRDANSGLPAAAAGLIADWPGPVLYNDAAVTATSLREGNPDFGLHLSNRINSLVGAETVVLAI